MGEFEDKLSSILNNPQAMSQIMSIAHSLGEDNKSTNSHASTINTKNESPDQSVIKSIDSDSINLITTLMSVYNRNDDRKVALLNALKPFVKAKRYSKVDKAIQIARISNVAKTAIEMFRSEEAKDV